MVRRVIVRVESQVKRMTFISSAMKKIIALFSGFLCLVACNQKIENPETDTLQKVFLTLNANSPELANAGGTRTEIHMSDGEIHPWWSKGDAIGLYHPIDNWDVEFDEFTSSLTSSSDRASFSGNTLARPEENGGLKTIAFYPYASHVETVLDYNTYEYIPKNYRITADDVELRFEIPYQQYPTETSFDPSVDLLISDPFYIIGNEQGGKTYNGSVGNDISFNRMNAILRLVLIDESGVLAGNICSYVGIGSFSSQLSGIAYSSLMKGSNSGYSEIESSGNEENDHSIYAVYGDQHVFGAEETIVWMVTIPTVLEAGSLLYIVGGSETGFSKQITLPKDIPLPAGLVTTLNIHINQDDIWEEN